MSERLKKIYRLLGSHKARSGYILAKLSVLVPHQIRSLRLKSTNPPMPFQKDLAKEAHMHQSRISMFETPGMANITLETLSKIAAALKVGVIVKFVPFSQMLEWENDFSPSADVVRLEDDTAFLEPEAVAQPHFENTMEILNQLVAWFDTTGSEENEKIAVGRAGYDTNVSSQTVSNMGQTKLKVAAGE